MVSDVRDDAVGEGAPDHFAAQEVGIEPPPPRLGVRQLDAAAERGPEVAQRRHDGRPSHERDEQGDGGVAPAGDAARASEGSAPGEQSQQGEVARVSVQPGDVP